MYTPSCSQARSLYNEIEMKYPRGGGVAPGRQTVSGAVMSAVGDVLDAVRILQSWLERKPFQASQEFIKVS